MAAGQWVQPEPSDALAGRQPRGGLCPPPLGSESVSAAQATASAQGHLMPAQMSAAQPTRTQTVLLWPKRVHRAPSPLPPFLPPSAEILE